MIYVLLNLRCLITLNIHTSTFFFKSIKIKIVFHSQNNTTLKHNNWDLILKKCNKIIYFYNYTRF